jgi:hypothetical protein
MWNPLKKISKKISSNDPNQMGFVQRLAMKKMQNMSPEQRMKLAQKMMTPENIAKNKDKILEAMEQMKALGQISDEQIDLAKKKLGL